MKKKLLFVVVAGTMLTGCYTHICPTYAVKPVKQKEVKAELHEDATTKDQKQSL